MFFFTELAFLSTLTSVNIIWNPSNCECECDKSCDVGVYLDYENCKCMKKLVDKLIEECTETVEEVKLAKITSAEHENKHKCSSSTPCIVFFFNNFYNSKLLLILLILIGT